MSKYPKFLKAKEGSSAYAFVSKSKYVFLNKLFGSIKKYDVVFMTDNYDMHNALFASGNYKISDKDEFHDMLIEIEQAQEEALDLLGDVFLTDEEKRLSRLEDTDCYYGENN
jgi:hypothetical protein